MKQVSIVVISKLKLAFFSLFFLHCLFSFSSNDSLYIYYSKQSNSEKKIDSGLGLLWQYRTNGEYKKSIALGLELITICNDQKNERKLAETYFRLANVYDDLAKYDTALFYANQSLVINDRLKLISKKAENYSIIGSIYYNQTIYGKAIDFYLKALTIREQEKNEAGLALLYNNIGNIYKDLGDYKKSYDYRIKSLSSYEKLGENIQVAIIKTNLAYDLTNMHDTVLTAIGLNETSRMHIVETYYGEALTVFQKNNIPLGVAAVYGNWGLWYNKIGDYHQALDYENKCYDLYKQLEMPLDMSAALGDISLVYNSLKNWKEAIRYGMQAKVIAEQTGNKFALSEIYRNLYVAHKALGNKSDALNFIEKWKVISDSLNGEQEKKSLTTKSLQYDFNKKVMADSIKNTELRKIEALKHEQEISEQRIYTYIGIIGFLLMLLVAYVLIKSNRQKQKDNQVIIFQKHLVEEKQKEIIDSINYAKRIQNSILPSEKYIEQVLKKLKNK